MTGKDENIFTVEYANSKLMLLDQTALPAVERYIECENWQRVAKAISDLEVRGAPAIGVTAAFGLVLAVKASSATTHKEILNELEGVAESLIATRPTAVNLAWAVQEVMEVARSSQTVEEMQQSVESTAQQLHAEDLAICKAIGDAGAELLAGAKNVITHCNAGGLATVGYGTALGVIRSAHRENPDLHVWVDETRPVLQGARLTSYELHRDGIDCTVIVDGAAASVLREGEVGAAVVGADRVAANGDAANKIGTYGLAVLARHHGVPFYVAAPLSTIDQATPNGASIEIEQRPSLEISEYRGEAITPDGVAVHNPAFDVTPAELIDGIITEIGVLRAPYAPAINEVLNR
tara:strand:+ start:2998 stop:4047 length:1050 start_codon:yes stop_codon:yes gene_type:complete